MVVVAQYEASAIAAAKVRASEYGMASGDMAPDDQLRTAESRVLAGVP